jgi:tetratricopeptide (TPR) repeat protein
MLARFSEKRTEAVAEMTPASTEKVSPVVVGVTGHRILADVERIRSGVALVLNHISPSANSATDLVEDYEALASLQKDLRDFDGANDCYDHAITELNSYLSGKTLTPAFSAILVRLHAARGQVFLEKKDRSGAEKEYKKAATEADGIDRKLQEARSYAVEADRTVGNAWRDLAEAVEDPAAKRKFIDLALRFPGPRQSEIGHG